MARIVALRWTPADFKVERHYRALWQARMDESGWTKFIDCRGVYAHYRPEPADQSPVILAAGFGAVFGPIFRRGEGGAAAVREIDVIESELLAAEAGARMCEKYWGHYSAWLHDRATDAFHVLRDPTGGGAVFTALLDGAHIFFTHAEDFVTLKGAVEADCEFLSAFITAPRLVASRTGIKDVREILAGQCVSVGRVIDCSETHCAWRPQAKAAQAKLSEFPALAQLLRQTVLDCAAAWSASFPEIGVRLSGGLDSSIVLAALHSAGARQLTAFNEHVEGLSEADERDCARAICERCNTRLVEIEVSSRAFDYAGIAAAPLSAKPTLAHTSFAVPSGFAAFDGLGAGALVATGQGGDQVLHRSHAAAIATDAWRDGLPLKTAIGVSVDTARLGATPVWAVFAEALAHLVWGKRRSALEPMSVLDDGRGAILASAIEAAHPWADCIRDATPARATRIAYLSDLQYYHQRDVLAGRFQVAPLLTAQPIVEFCLATPPYVMTRGGVDRALARAAFNDLLPPNIIQRTAKASTTRFHTQVLERQMPLMREMLMGGALVRAGVIDASRVAAVLANDTINDVAAVVALSSAMIAETWLRRLQQTVHATQSALAAAQGAAAAAERS